MHLIFFYINHLDQVLRQIFNASAYIYVFVKNTTEPSNTVFIFTDMKLLVIIALGMKVSLLVVQLVATINMINMNAMNNNKTQY